MIAVSVRVADDQLLKLLCNHRIICLERDIRCDGLATEIASPLVLVALNDGLACLKGNVFDLRVVGLILVHPAPAARAYRMVQLVQFTAQNISPFEGILTQFALPHGVEGPDVSNRNLFNALLMEPRQVAWEHQIVILSPGSKRHLPIRLGVCIILIHKRFPFYPVLHILGDVQSR